MTKISSFAQADAYLLGTIGETISPRTSYKLDRMRTLLRELGDPHLAYPTIHIGGTSGKGSTSTMVAAALQAAGKRTGLHTKPHLRSATERARVNGVAVSPERFAELLDAMMPAIERVAIEYGRPTYYETLLALAFLHFERERVDVAAIEVGLGGRLDGTNVISPEAAAITSIGYDHTDVLGDMLESIAFEKAGIAKAGVPLVVADVPPQALEVIERCACVAGATVIRVRDAARLEHRPDASVDGSERGFCVVTTSARYDLRLGVLGTFQRRNAATAIVLLEQLRGELRPDRDAIERGFAGLSIPGRMEVLTGHPTVVFDIAHNVEKAGQLVESLRESFPGRRVAYVVAVSEGKDAEGIVRALAPLASRFFFTSFAVAGRTAVEPGRLASIAESLGRAAYAVGDPLGALAAARRSACADDELVAVTGSTFVVAALRECRTPAAAR